MVYPLGPDYDHITGADWWSDLRNQLGAVTPSAAVAVNLAIARHVQPTIDVGDYLRIPAGVERSVRFEHWYSDYNVDSGDSLYSQIGPPDGSRVYEAGTTKLLGYYVGLVNPDDDDDAGLEVFGNWFGAYLFIDSNPFRLGGRMELPGPTDKTGIKGNGFGYFLPNGLWLPQMSHITSPQNFKICLALQTPANTGAVGIRAGAYVEVWPGQQRTYPYPYR